LLSVLTAAQPKIADYPFTTLAPNLGIVALGEYESCTLADIPGLIEGASRGRGLGHEFLRHIERTRALLLLVDAAAGDPGRACGMLRAELRAHRGRLERRPFAVVLTKADLVAPENAERVIAAARAWGQEHGARAVHLVSAVAGTGLDRLRHLLRDLQHAGRALDEPPPAAGGTTPPSA
jgi:GTP-binding protein